ncbi:MAG: hypothetical protein IT196_07460 [Acidimicrobiales bacterium]|nr:hypothetical protein [Acidimicrobiales bacterium]
MRHRSLAATAAGLVLIAGGCAADAAAGDDGKGKTMTVEVAETGLLFTTDGDHMDPATNMPLRGNFFVTSGYLYKPGTVHCTEGVCDGVLYDDAGQPSPEFPDAVIGAWTCYGTFLVDAPKYESGAMVATTQIFDLSDQPGTDSIITSGVEIMLKDSPFHRAVTGGTGAYRTITGEQTQTYLGDNNPDLVFNNVAGYGVTHKIELPSK